MDKPGTVYLIGAGPGDPGLLTRRASELLAACDVVVCDALVTPEVLALASPRAEVINAGKRAGKHELEQDQIQALLVRLAREGKRVARLKGGDPYVFGRGGEEALHLAEEGIPFEVVPGVTAGVAAAACAGIPVTHRKYTSSVAFVTGHEEPGKGEPAYAASDAAGRSALNFAALAKVGTLCFYMGTRNLEQLTGELRKHLPPETPVAVISWGATPRQRVVAGTLADAAERARAAGLAAPALTVVGEVVRLREKLAVFERRPLFGRRIVVTRPRGQAGGMSELLQGLGAEVLPCPTIRLEPPADKRSFEVAVRRLSDFDWVIFTSVNGVRAVWEELERRNLDARAFGRARLAAVGPATEAELALHGLRADLVPRRYVTAEIAEALRAAGALDKPLARFLLARADTALPELPERLRELGGDVVEVVAYRTVFEKEAPAEVLKALADGEVDAVTFTSGTTVQAFAALLGPERLRAALSSRRLRCLSIGPVTSQAMREAGLPVHGEAAEHDIPGLARLLLGLMRGADGG